MQIEKILKQNPSGGSGYEARNFFFFLIVPFHEADHRRPVIFRTGFVFSSIKNTTTR